MTQHIKTERLVLRPYAQADRPALIDILGRWEVAKWLASVPHPFTEDDVRITREDGSSRWPGTMAITLGGDLIGAVSTVPHLGYFLHPDHWGQGFATEAAGATRDHCFETTDAERLVSGVFLGNPGSQKVLEKLGFAGRGYSEQFCAARNETLRHLDMELTRADWEADR